MKNRIKQKTTTDIGFILNWIHTQPHHSVEHEYRKDATNWPDRPCTHFSMSNHFEKLRVPWAAWQKCRGFIESNKRPFDTRKFALTRQGRKALRESKHWQENQRADS